MPSLASQVSFFLLLQDLVQVVPYGHWSPSTLALSKTSPLPVKLTNFCLMEINKKNHVLFSCTKATFYSKNRQPMCMVASANCS
jgi:hypothetical protein